jgi:hypothetical protein
MDRIVKKTDETDVSGMVSQGIGALGRIESTDVIPPVLGATLTFGSTLLIRKFAKTKPSVVKYAPIIGAGIGVVGSMTLSKWGGKKAVTVGALTSVAAGVGLFAYERISVTTWAASGIFASKRVSGRGVGEARLEGGRGRVQPTAFLPPGMAWPNRGQVGAIDVTAFAANPT